jgi:CoA:oxalate CoA-transferase
MLSHLRVVELGQVIAGTVGGMILADLGAEVIKVEPLSGDAGRRSAVYGVGPHSAIHLMFNRSKKSIGIDLKQPRGRQVLLDLVARSDAVVENFRPGVMERLGVGFEDLRRVKEDLVLVSVSGFGADGPYRDYPAYDLIMQAMSGHMSIMGEPGRPPVIMGIPIADIIAGVYSAIAVLAGVEGRRESGSGAHFDIAMLDVMVAMLAHVGTLYLNTGIEQQPQGSAHPFITPWQAFRCSDGEYLVVAPREEHFWQKLAECLNLPELSLPEYADAVSRQDHRDRLLPILCAAFEARPMEEWLATLRAAGVPVAPVNKTSQVFADPHIRHREMVQSYDLGDATFKVIGNPLRIEGRAEPSPGRAPQLGADTDSIVAGLLEYDPEALAELRRDGVIA